MGIDYYGVLQINRTSTNLEIRKASEDDFDEYENILNRRPYVIRQRPNHMEFWDDDDFKIRLSKITVLVLLEQIEDLLKFPMNRYRNLALRFNPERLKDDSAGEVFALIAEAYDVLGNPERRAVFDQYGEEGLKRGVPGPDDYITPYHFHGDAMQTYKDFFGTVSPYADLLDFYIDPKPIYDIPEGRGFKKKQPPIYHTLSLTLHEIFFGGVKKMKIQRLEFIGPERLKTEIKEKILSVPIKPGIPAGTEIVMPEEGDQNPTQIPADIIFVVEDKTHEHFVRDNNNLITQAEISLQEALLGTTVTVNTIDHRTIRIPITDIVCPGYEKFVPHEGMPIVDEIGCKGDLIIRFQVKYPDYLPKASKTTLEKAFYLAKVGGGRNQHELINKMILADKILRVDPDDQLPPF